MKAIRRETTIQSDGELHLTQLPCKRGDRVEVIVLVPEPSAEEKEAAQRVLSLVSASPFRSPGASASRHEPHERPSALPLECQPSHAGPNREAVMADFAIYWRNFSRESSEGDWPCTRWFTNSDRLARQLSPGSRLWLFTSGDACGMAEARLGYLVEVFNVWEVVRNAGGNPDYPAHDFAYTLVGEPDRCVKVDPPLLVDDIVRPRGHDTSAAIGRLRQSPWRLPDAIIAQLQDRLLRECGKALGNDPRQPAP